MKIQSAFFALLAFVSISNAQTPIDNCFTSVPYGTSFAGSATLANTTDADMLEWNGTTWLGQWGAANVNEPPPCVGTGQKAIWMGDQTNWTTGGEGFALLLNAPLVSGQTYSFAFTYISDGLYSNGAFAPYICTNSIADYGSAYQIGSLPAVGYTWTTNVYSFTATPSQNNHQWLILHSNDGSGTVMSFCDAQAYVSAGSDTTICIGDSILLDAGAGYSTYSWSNGASTQSIYASAPGAYVVFVTNTCGFAFDTVNVTTQVCAATPNVNFASSDTSFCEKQCLDFFDLSTNSPTSWQWLFTGATPDTSTLQNPTNICYNNYGTFDVQLIACNSMGCDTLTISNFITELQNPVDSIWQVGFTLYSLPAYSYQWYELTTGLIAGATDSFYTATQPGDYYCVVADTIGCIATSNTINVTNTSVFENEGSDFVLYPNPSSGSFYISFDKQKFSNASLKIFDRLGKKVYETFSISPDQIFETDFSSGVYSVQFESEGLVVNKILIVHKP